jgi:hypothetical protein
VFDFHGIEDAAIGIDTDKKRVAGGEITEGLGWVAHVGQETADILGEPQA